MKKLLLIISLILSMTLLASCGAQTPPPADDDGGNNTPVTPPEEEEDGALAIVINSAAGDDLAPAIAAIEKAIGKTLTKKEPDSVKKGQEILLGDTGRAATVEAASVLNVKKSLWAWDQTGYIIYARGGDLAVCWTDEYGLEAAAVAIGEILTENKDLKFEDGILKSENFSYIEAMEAEEALFREEQLQIAEDKYGKAVRDEIEKHLSIYGEEFYLWLASLYDPGLYDEQGNPLGGGFYYSVSARDNPGYLIDIESTMQVLNLLMNLDMVREYNNDLSKALPEKMQKEMIAFAQSLQSSVDGYFYHPQWGTNIQTSRLSRDLGWATSLLKAFGAKPLYDAPNGTKGMYGPPPGTALTESLQDAGAMAVSKVIATATKWPNQLATLDNWKAYLEAYAANIRTKSYSIGNTVTSQNAQILNREKEGIASGELIDADGDGIAEDGFVMATKNFFDKHQNPENGTWESGTVAKGTISYASTNGLMKISSIYSGLGVPMNYCEEAFYSGLYIALLEGKDCYGVEAENSVYVYNAFTGMQNALNNLKKSNPAKYDELSKVLADNAVDLIRITSAKALKFKKADGSFGYTWTTSPDKSQGVPVAVPGTVEGSVNGGGGAYTTITNQLLGLLGIDMRLQFESDFEKFLHAVDGAVHIEK